MEIVSNMTNPDPATMTAAELEDWSTLCAEATAIALRENRDGASGRSADEILAQLIADRLCSDCDGPMEGPKNEHCPECGTCDTAEHSGICSERSNGAFWYKDGLGDTDDLAEWRS
jgi:hypothetical protein